MSPAEILITCCLGAAPALLGILLGIFLSRSYKRAQEWYTQKWESVPQDSLREKFWSFLSEDEETIDRRSRIILVFWPFVFALAGGFLAGSYMQFVFGWWSKFMELMLTGVC